MGRGIRDGLSMVLSKIEEDNFVRELSLFDTGLLSVLLCLSLVLPMVMSLRNPRRELGRDCIKMVWAGQLVGALAGVIVLVSARLAPFAVGIAVVSCLGLAAKLLRKTRSGETMH